MLWRSLVVFLLLAGTALAAVTPTTPEPVCVHANGHEYKVGATYHPDACTYCMCFKTGERCEQPCPGAPCLVPVQKDGECCPHCPDGPDCKGHDGEILPQGTVQVYSETHFCECPRLTAEELVHPHYQLREPNCHMDTGTEPPRPPA